MMTHRLQHLIRSPAGGTRQATCRPWVGVFAVLTDQIEG